MYFERDKVIKDIYYVGAKKNRAVFNVAYGVDYNFLFGSMVSMTSLLINNPNIDFSFHIFTDYIDDDYCLKIRKLSHQYHAEITLYLVDCDEFKKLPSTKNWSYAMYFRFIALDFIHTDEDRILYLDADIICKKSIKSLLQTDLKKCIAAVVKDGDINFWHERATFFNQPEIANGYFNSGVMLVNLIEWSKKNITQKAMEILSNHDMQKKLTFPDQDVLNILLCKDILFLEHIYNTQTSLNFELQCKRHTIYPHQVFEETVFIHYIGPTKPWHKWATYPISKYFNLAKNESPWKDDSLVKAHSSSLLRYQAKHYFKQNKWVKAICSYINYFYKKL